MFATWMLVEYSTSGRKLMFDILRLELLRFAGLVVCFLSFARLHLDSGIDSYITNLYIIFLVFSRLYDTRSLLGYVD